MSLKGSLREAPLPDILQLLAMGRKSGCLSLSHRGNFGSMYFDGGRITFASIVNRRDRLGQRLVQSGAITREQLQTSMDVLASQPGARLGDLLVAQGLISRQALREHLAVQVEETVYLLYTWSDGTFSFEAGSAPHADDLVAIPPESLMLEGARRMDEWTLMQQSVPNFDIVFELDADALARCVSLLSPEQTRVLEGVDGARDVNGVADASGMSEFDVGKALHDLLGLGVVRRREGPAGSATAEATRSQVEEHRNLGVAFYRARMYDEAAREFRHVVHLTGDDLAARGYCGRAYLHQGRWEDALQQFEVLARPGASAATFHNLALALERLGRYAEAREALDKAVAHGGDRDPRVQTSRGIVALYLGDARAADAALSTARALGTVPSAAWYHHAALAAAWLGNLPGALSLLDEAIAAHPSATLYCNLAALLERCGRVSDAMDAAKAALAEPNPPAQAQKNIGDLYYGARRYDDAHEAFERAISMNPRLGADVYLKLGNIQLRRRSPAEAASCWARALELEPDNEIIRVNLETLQRQ